MPALFHFRNLALPGLAVVALAACNAPAPEPALAPTPTTPAPGNAATAPLAASEYFETLTEEAFTATPARLDVTIAQAREAAARDRRDLPADVTARIDQRLQEIATHRATMARADLALSSVEAYRLFVSAGSKSEPVPMAVSLLDYAGFRYTADLKAQPARWDDAMAAADYAAAQWALISDRIGDPALKARFDAAVTGLKTATDSRDTANALSVAGTELDLVDELEAWFTAHPAVPATGA